jgi:A/G-specific adenine glycosylase
VLVSEIMLQQTQAARVIPFFSRWMDQFPTIVALASASETSVLKAWEGLGYYSRARSLHATSKIISEQYNGRVPKTESDLLALPGIGPYTAGAIRAFAFHERAVAVDANVIRVINRLLPNVTLASVRVAVETLLPQRQPWHAMEALIELGAIICTPTPLCSSCPLANSCHARATDSDYRRVRSYHSSRTALWRDVAVMVHDNCVLVVRTTKQRLMAGLYEFPSFESSSQGRSVQDFEDFLHPHIPTSYSVSHSLPPVTHTFTRFHATLYPHVVTCASVFPWTDGQWLPIDAIEALPFSAGHARVRKGLAHLVHRGV